MKHFIRMGFERLICRIGSLEIEAQIQEQERILICRIGSLEIDFTAIVLLHHLICRIGSLEN